MISRLPLKSPSRHRFFHISSNFSLVFICIPVLVYFHQTSALPHACNWSLPALSDATGGLMKRVTRACLFFSDSE